MDNRPIGVFDSGLGGLTVVKSILEELPEEDIVYFGDTKHMPYGNRSKETLLEFVTDNILFLLNHDVKAIVIACNTADSMTRTEMQRRFNIPIVGVVGPAGVEATRVTKNNKIGIIGTTATIESGAYGEIIRQEKSDAYVYAIPCPLLAPLVEEGRITADDTVTMNALEGYLGRFRTLGIDTLVLGCTHYPLLRPLIESILPGVTIISSGHASTNSLIETLDRNGLRCEKGKQGSVQFFVNDAPDKFAKNGGMFIGREITNLVVKTDVGK